MSEVAAELARVFINEHSPEQVIVLREKGGQRQFPIVIGMFEAWAIDRKLREAAPPRPMTHDLLADVITSLGGRITKVLVSDLDSGTFFARLFIQQDQKEHCLDCRPSDAVAIAVRLGAPLFVDEAVFEKLTL